MMSEEYISPICEKCIKVKEERCCHDVKIPLLVKDVENITSLGHELADYAVAGEYTEEDLLEYPRWVFEGLVEVDGRLVKLNVKTEGSSCVFLKEGVGCTLGDLRPVSCKLFPFWLEESGKVKYSFGGIECIMEDSNIPVSEGLSAIGETEESIKSYYKKTKKECLENKEKQRELIMKLRSE